MLAFWDTSAVLALIFNEVHSPHAKAANDETELFYAWRWIEVEGRLGCGRRRGNALQREFLDRWLVNVEHIELLETDYPSVIALGDRHRLRAAYAGHLFILLQARRLFSEIVFVCFDDELSLAARKEGVEIWE